MFVRAAALISRFDVKSGEGELRQTPWDLCIVGAGAAGLALASQFLDTRWRVVVLESGLLDPDPVGDDLNKVTSTGLRHDGWNAGRVRSFGGTTRAWGGQLVPMRSSEFAARPWIPASGWPLDLEVLQPYYRRAEELLRIEGPPYDAPAWARLGMTEPGFDPSEFCVRFSQWAALGRRNFALLWRRELQKSNNISVLLDATAVAVRCTPDGGHCEGVEVASRTGRRDVVRARYCVVACGGIETARLLLASNSGDGTVANRSGLVGRYFQDHISYMAGELEPASRRAVQQIFDPRYIGSTMFSLKLEPTEAAMRRNGWLNAMAHLAFQIPDALGWLELRRILRSVQAGRLVFPSWREGVEMMRAGGELAKLILTRYLANRRRSPDSGGILLLVDTEQAPDADSRIVLDDVSVDSLGVPRARLNWRTSDLEYTTLTGFAKAVAAEFARLGLGQVRLAGPPDPGSRDCLGAARDIYHHMGTTRMSDSPLCGVTRTDLRCHDVDNLFIAGPSVFPAGGIANPTFTALALTLRLADHLKSLAGAHAGG